MRTRWLLSLSFILGLACQAFCQEEKPAPKPEVTEDGWQDLVDELVPPPPAEEPQEPEEEPEPTGPVYTHGQMLLLNITRARNSGLQPHPTLMASAQRLAEYHASTGRWGHSSRSWRPSNTTENIAWNGTKSVTKLGVQWANSRGHNSNWLTNRNYVGVGVAYSGGRVYGVQHFSNSPGGLSSGTPYLQSSRSTTARSRRGWGLFRRRR